MKKNQNGVSMVSLVITIIVIIILAAVAFSGSQETIGRAGFSGFVTDIDSVRSAFMTENIPNLMGEQAAKNNAVSEAQAYNFLAKGATTLDQATVGEHAWLSRSQANAIPCTRIEKETAKEAIGIELPKRTVNTFAATGVEVEYFVTNKGDIFVWPPFARSDDGLFYVNDTTPVISGDASKTKITTDKESAMYKDGFTFVVNGVNIKVQGAAKNPTAAPLKDGVTVGELTAMPSIYYFDERNAETAEGIESRIIYQDNTAGAESTLTGMDND